MCYDIFNISVALGMHVKHHDDDPSQIPNPDLLTSYLSTLLRDYACAGKLNDHEPSSLDAMYWKALDLGNVALDLSGHTVWSKIL
jgi:hypothetical protein